MIHHLLYVWITIGRYNLRVQLILTAHLGTNVDINLLLLKIQLLTDDVGKVKQILKLLMHGYDLVFMDLVNLLELLKKNPNIFLQKILVELL